MTTLKFRFRVEPAVLGGGMDIVEQNIPVPNETAQDPRKMQLFIQSAFLQFAIGGLIEKKGSMFYHIPARRVLDGWVEVPSIIVADMSAVPPPPTAP